MDRGKTVYPPSPFGERGYKNSIPPSPFGKREYKNRMFFKILILYLVN
jgi:hypothetical protein